MNDSTFTYRDLLFVLDEMTDGQLDQAVQIAPSQPNKDKPTGLMPVIAFNTVQYFFHDGEEVCQETRSAEDWKHHPEQFVLLADDHPFSDQGDFYYELTEDGWKGDKTGKPPEDL